MNDNWLFGYLPKKGKKNTKTFERYWKKVCENVI